MLARAYLRASTQDQDAGRAENDLREFAKSNKLRVAGWYRENESGAKLDRPELFRLLADSEPGDILLVEQVDRLSRLTGKDWEALRKSIKDKGVRVVALDLPTSHQLVSISDEFTARMLEALNGMMLDMLAAIARKDYEDRRRRQAQGIATAKAKGRYRGRPVDAALHKRIAKCLTAGMSWSEIQATVQCSRGTIANVKRAMAIDC